MTVRSPSRDSAREILDALVRDAADTGLGPLSAGHLRAVEWVEKLPGNRSGADKSWVPRQFEAAMRVRAGAKRLR
jgi:hypothetical protein